jgi:SAM-dependent methyltransferase
VSDTINTPVQQLSNDSQKGDGKPALLRTDEALHYWDDRHVQRSERLSGGDLALDEAGNHAFYLRRAGTLLELIERHLPLVEPCFALDAGCGTGFFAANLERCGIRVMGIDASPAAISYCRRHHPGAYVQSRLDTFEYPDFFDCVYAIDVLFDIVDDGVWAASFENLASLTRPGGLLVVTDHHGTNREQLGNYIVHRPITDYLALAQERDLDYQGFTPYNFRTNRRGFHTFVRPGVH